MILTDYDYEVINAIVERIDRLRTEHGYSVYQLAQRANIPENTLKHIFKKKNYPNYYTIHRICEAFGMTAAESFMFDSASVKFTKAEIDLLHDYEKLSVQSRAILCELVKHMK